MPSADGWSFMSFQELGVGLRAVLSVFVEVGVFSGLMAVFPLLEEAGV